MIEKVNPAHPDKIADRIAGAILDLAYRVENNPKVAVEVLIGHDNCYIIIETTAFLQKSDIEAIVCRLAGDVHVKIHLVPQDAKLAENQKGHFRCGDNGIFLGMPTSDEEKKLSKLARMIYADHPTDGKYILDKNKFIICQSNADTKELKKRFSGAIVNPLGDWTGGFNVDTGATNRKLGSDMGRAVTGGGLHGKDLSKADVSINIYAHLKAQKTGRKVELSCAIGDEVVDGKPYSEIVEIARKYIKSVGGFEKFAEWGII